MVIETVKNLGSSSFKIVENNGVSTLYGQIIIRLINPTEKEVTKISLSPLELKKLISQLKKAKKELIKNLK